MVGLGLVDGARSAASLRAAGRHVIGLFSVGARSAASHGAAGRHVIHKYGPGRDLVGLPATTSGVGTVLGSLRATASGLVTTSGLGTVLGSI